MLLKNLWTSHGLVNGSLGTVVGIVPGSVVLVQFGQSYLGPSAFEVVERVVPIPIEEFEFTHGTTKKGGTRKPQQCKRCQFPLVPAWAITIHKSQGMTVGPGECVEKIVVDVGDKEWAAGMLYVAVSRPVSAECIRLDPMRPFARWARVGQTDMAKKILRHIRELHDKSGAGVG